MRIFPIFLFVFLSACGNSTSRGTPSPDPSGKASMSLTYQCDSGKTIMAAYPTDSTAVVEYDNRRIQMKIAVSGSGARYVGERLEWWTKGSGEGATGTLFRHLEDGTSGEVIEQCLQVEDSGQQIFTKGV